MLTGDLDENVNGFLTNSEGEGLGVTQGREDCGTLRVRSNLRASTELRATKNLGTTNGWKEIHRNGAESTTAGVQVEDRAISLL